MASIYREKKHGSKEKHERIYRNKKNEQEEWHRVPEDVKMSIYQNKEKQL